MVMQTIFYSSAGIYMFKVNNKNTRTRFKICSKFTPCSGTSIVNFEHVIADWISTLIYLQIASTYIYVYPKLKSICGFWVHRQTTGSSHRSYLKEKDQKVL